MGEAKLPHHIERRMSKESFVIAGGHPHELLYLDRRFKFGVDVKQADNSRYTASPQL